jgi:penicillin-binding protein 1B
MAKPKQVQTSWRQTSLRRSYQVATSRFFLIPLVIVSLILIGVLFYYYNLYTQIIDARLRGDVFVRSSGIYAAPLNLYDGSGMRMGALISHLRSVGYIDQGAAQSERRGRFVARGNTIEIYPGTDALINGEQAFHNLRVVFGRDGSVIQSITDIDSRQKLGRAQVEPELISSVINQEREKRKNVEYKDLPQNLVDAIVAIEDRQFFEHPGINWRGILRALVRDYQLGEIREGGSSVTQQLVKNFFLKPERTLKRKLSEAYMSILLEQRLSKEEIMAMYCNQIYLGQRGGFSINGFGQAARAYFGKDISNITLAEAAFLAGIIRSPNAYSPYSNEDRALERRNLVLEKMYEVEKITRAEADAAKRQSLGVVGKASGVDASDAPYFVDYLMRQLETQYPDGQMLRSMRIYSTIDLTLQRLAYQAVARNMIEVDRLLARRRGGTAGLQAALVAMNAKTGEIVAMVGGRDYATSQLNRATDAKRQPGSAFKPFVYAAALEEGNDESGTAVTPASMFMDEPRTFEYDGKSYDPGNFGEKYEGRAITVRDALVNSKNVVTVEIAQRLGFSQVARFAERAGFTRVPPYPSIALGVGEATPLQVTAAYTSFANRGTRVSPIAIKRVTSKDGTVLFESRTETRDVMSPQVAYIMTSMMEDVINRGTGTRVRQMGFQGTAAGKTGTSRDGWFAGYTPNLVCVVWVGFDDNSDIGLTGGATAAPIWADFMMRAVQIRPELGGRFEAPGEGIVTYDIDPMTGQIAQGGSNVRHELFLRGTEPGGQVLPDSSIPESEPPPVQIDPESPRPTPTPRPPGGDGLRTGVDDNMIPLPPEARRSRPRPDSESPPKSESGRPSFLRKIASAIGLASSEPKKAEPTPTPWTQGGLKPVRQREIDDDGTIPLPPDAVRPRDKATPKPTPLLVRPVPTPSVKPDIAQRETKPVTSGKQEPTPVPKLVPVATPAPPTPRQTSTFVLEVCEVTGLLPVTNVCKTTQRKRFQLGREPTTYCSHEAHRKK